MADPSPTRRRTQLDTLQDVKAELARTVRKLRAIRCDDYPGKDLAPVAGNKIKQASAMVHALSMLADIIERADIEARLNKLEERTARGETPAVQ
jgi:hypothetical protein